MFKSRLKRAFDSSCTKRCALSQTLTSSQLALMAAHVIQKSSLNYKGFPWPCYLLTLLAMLGLVFHVPLENPAHYLSSQ